MTTRTAVQLFIAAFGLSVSLLPAAATSPAKGSAPPGIFEDASGLLGQPITIRGYLRWTFENKNLFPLGTTESTVSTRQCLPMLIRSNESRLIKQASQLDGRDVEVRGTVVRAAPEGMVSVPSCRQVGIEVTDIAALTQQ